MAGAAPSWRASSTRQDCAAQPCDSRDVPTSRVSTLSSSRWPLIAIWTLTGCGRKPSTVSRTYFFAAFQTRDSDLAARLMEDHLRHIQEHLELGSRTEAATDLVAIFRK